MKNPREVIGMFSLFHKDKLQIPADISHIAQAQNFIIDFLKTNEISNKSLVSAYLVSEEVLAFLIQNRQSDNDTLQVKADYSAGNAKITIDAKGKPFSKEQLFQLTSESTPDAEDDRYNEIVLERILRTVGKNISVTNRAGRNVVVIQVEKSAYNKLYKSLIAIFIGIICGILIRLFLPENVADFIASDILGTISGIFLNALKMISVPFIFFSIMNGIAGFKDVRALGKTSARILTGFVLTTVAAMFIAYGLSVVLPAGDPSLRSLLPSVPDTAGEIKTVTLTDTLKNIVPTDIISPFAESNTLQVVFLAVLLGTSILLISDKYPQLSQVTYFMNAWFLKACTLITSFTAFISFCSITQLCIQIDTQSTASILSWLRQIYVADFLQLILYLVLIAVLGRSNPIQFLKDCMEIITTAFSTSSSNATLPVTMQSCKNKLNIAPKIYTFSIPFGAAIHRDGTTITQMVSILFFARIFEIPITGSVLFSLMITIFSLSMGEGALAGVSVLLLQLNIPSSALNLIIGLYGIAGMIQTVNNVTGDVVVTTIVDRMEKRETAQKVPGSC